MAPPHFSVPPLSPEGIEVMGEIREPGFLEGGDFFPCGYDLSLVGVGLRSNVEACEQLMGEDLLGTRRLAVVKDEFERHQVWQRGVTGCFSLGLELAFGASRLACVGRGFCDVWVAVCAYAP